MRFNYCHHCHLISRETSVLAYYLFYGVKGNQAREISCRTCLQLYICVNLSTILNNILPKYDSMHNQNIQFRH